MLAARFRDALFPVNGNHPILNCRGALALQREPWLTAGLSAGEKLHIRGPPEGRGELWLQIERDLVAKRATEKPVVLSAAQR